VSPSGQTVVLEEDGEILGSATVFHALHLQRVRGLSASARVALAFPAT
jgi:hypothetical protein